MSDVSVFFCCDMFVLILSCSGQDEYPLASLPIIGYTVTVPSEEDNMSKNYVFKLQFKTHIYFFRAESEYAFHKWMEVISNSTSGTIPTPNTHNPWILNPLSSRFYGLMFLHFSANFDIPFVQFRVNFMFTSLSYLFK